MMQLKPNKGVAADLPVFDVTISSKERGFATITKLVVSLSILLAILMIAI